MVVRGTCKTVETQSQKAFFKKELEELIIGFVNLLLRDINLPQVRGSYFVSEVCDDLALEVTVECL
jgi:hypothetical protein